LIHGWAPFRHSDQILLQHVLPIFLKERIATAQRGQRFQIQKRLKNLVHPDIVGHLVDPSGRRQQGAAGESRSEGGNRGFLALGRWRGGGTAGTSGSAVGFGGHFFLAKIRAEDFVAGPRIHFGWKMDNESMLNLTVILHGIT
jgi:hypothetical protein